MILVAAAVLLAVIGVAVAVFVQRDRDWWMQTASDVRDARDELAREAAEKIEEPAAWLDRKLVSRVIVHTHDDLSYDGLLEVNAVDGVVLVAARILSEGGMTVAGEVFIPRSQVRFVQVPRGAE